MRQFFAGLILALSISTLMGTSAGAQNARALTSAEIAQHIIGNTIKQVDDQYWAFFEPTGSLGGLYVNMEEQGKWAFFENQLCQQWTNWADGRPMCFYVLQGTGGAFRFDDGQGGGFNVVIKDGNPMGL